MVGEGVCQSKIQNSSQRGMGAKKSKISESDHEGDKNSQKFDHEVYE